MNDHPLLFGGRRAHSPVGVVTARVERLEDDGTCRLRIFGMSGQDGDDETVPARIMMPSAGEGRGIHFLPEPGDEVVCAFSASHSSLPIVIGSLWNGRSTPPEQARRSRDNHVRTIVSRSGHEITLDDTPGAEKVTIRTQHGHFVELDDAPAGPKVTLQSRGERRVVLDDRPPGRVSMQTPTCQITMDDGGGTLSIDATGAINLSAPSISINGMNVSMTASAGTCRIDGVPFRLHTHTGVDTGAGTSGPVGP